MELQNAVAENAIKQCHQLESDEERMGFSSVELPVFEKRPHKERYQVRFWSTPEAYNRFVEEVEKNDLVIQDVMNNLMAWFTNTSQSGVLKHRIVERSHSTAEQQG